jgi:hypothetical protein
MWQAEVGEDGRTVGSDYIHVPIVLKSGSLNLLEPSGPVQACGGIALPLLITWRERENVGCPTPEGLPL